VATKPLIAIVEDDESLRTALVKLIWSLGYNSIGFESAEAFIDASLAGTCSCVITDFQMAGMSGLDLIRVMAARQPPVEVIMITARNDPGLEASALSCGAVCFLRKPIDTDVLVGCIEKAMNK